LNCYNYGMKLSLECSTKGKIKIGKQLKVVEGSKEYLLIPDDKGWLSKIKIIKKVAVPNEYSAMIGPGEGKVKAVINIRGSREEYLELIREFQELESILSFASGGALESIEWDAPKEDFIPETEDEERKVHVKSFQFRKKYPEWPVFIGEESFDAIIRSKERYSSVMVALAFLREGVNEFSSRRYINAFYNFYFVLEDLYGERKTKNWAIEKEFRNSKELRKWIRWAIKDNLNKYVRHRTNIEKFCKEEKVLYDIDGLISLVVNVRGNLHHYSSGSSKHKGTPFNHEDFESIAFLTMGLALKSIGQRILEIDGWGG
jgi:hypothetical protein